MKTTKPVAGLSLYASLFKDLVAWDEDLRIPLARDLTWLRGVVASRGWSITMIDFPECGKLIDFALSRGFIDRSKIPESIGYWAGGTKVFFGASLIDKAFDDTGRLLFDVQPRTIFLLRQVYYLTKKVRKECGSDAVLSEVEDYRSIDSSLRVPSHDWLGDAPDFWNREVSVLDSHRVTPDMVSDRDHCPRAALRYVERVADVLIARMPNFDWREVQPRHGPGAVADQKTGTDKYSPPNWPRKLERVFPFSYFGCSREDLVVTSEVSYPRTHEPPARLLAVPKTLKGPRMIASEPVAHQYIQLGLMRWIRENIPGPLRNSIDFRDQTASQRLCSWASISQSLATVDLSAASDRLSCWLVERIFRKNPSFLEALHACRTRWLVNATGVGEPYFLTLRKYAPMGNGTTFPVQSVIYTIITMAAVLYELGWKVSHETLSRLAKRGCIRVFGDDIILPSFAVPTLALLLTHFELKVNVAKSHYVGAFRESCGYDAFNGEDVSPLYLRDLELSVSPEHLASWCDVQKNAARLGLTNLSEEMRALIPEEYRKNIPLSQGELGCLTLWSYFPGQVYGKKRFNTRLHRQEVRGLVLSTKEVRRKRETYGSLLQYFIERPHPDTNWSSGYTIRRRTSLRVRWVPVLL